MITDELREWMKGSTLSSWTAEHLLAIADRIDAEHERLMAEQFDSLTFDMKPMTDESMAKNGWVRGPLDADGEMWRRGDMSDSNWGVIEGIAYEDGRWLISGHDISAPWIPADSIRHYHAPTVEDVLREFAEKMNENMGMYTGEAIDADEWRDADAKTIAEYAKRLKLAEGEDA